MFLIMLILSLLVPSSVVTTSSTEQISVRQGRVLLEEIDSHGTLWRGRPPRVCAAGVCDHEPPTFCVATKRDLLREVREGRRDPCSRTPRFRDAGDGDG